MKIVADENIVLVDEFFSSIGSVETYAGRSIKPEQVKDADVLLVRSVTQVNEELLAGSGVKFVGTCTIGTDHVDQAYLSQKGIGFSNAPGCNAHAVVDYVLSALARLALEQDFLLTDKVVGIVGLGNVGSRLRARLEKLGVTCLSNDPPLAEGGQAGLVPLDQLLKRADVISLHTPITKSGLHSTHHLLNADNLSLLKPGAILLNAGRGAVIDNTALKHVLIERPDLTAVLDVWEHEPDVDLELLAQVALATPHIAGYSLEGKIAGTAMVYEALCDYLQLPIQVRQTDMTPPAEPISLPVQASRKSMQKLSYQAVLDCYDVKRDDGQFRQVIRQSNENRRRDFDRLRKDYPVRRELRVTAVENVDDSASLKAQLSAFGFEV